MQVRMVQSRCKTSWNSFDGQWYPTFQRLRYCKNPMNSRTLVPFQHQVLKLYRPHDLPSCIYQVPHVRRLFSSASYESRNSRTDTRSYAAGSAMEVSRLQAIQPSPCSHLVIAVPSCAQAAARVIQGALSSGRLVVWSQQRGGSMWGRPSSVPTAESERATDGARYTSGHSPTRSSAGLQSIGVGAAVAGGSASELELVGKAAIEGMLRGARLRPGRGHFHRDLRRG